MRHRKMRSHKRDIRSDEFNQRIIHEHTPQLPGFGHSFAQMASQSLDSAGDARWLNLPVISLGQVAFVEITIAITQPCLVVLKRLLDPVDKHPYRST